MVVAELRDLFNALDEYGQPHLCLRDAGGLWEICREFVGNEDSDHLIVMFQRMDSDEEEAIDYGVILPLD